MHIAYLLIGGNLGNREQNLNKAVQMIGQYAGTVTRLSAVYETAAWGNIAQPAFLNQAVELETNHPAPVLMDVLLHIEHLMGRQREERYGPRPIDIDILLYDNEVHDSQHLRLPHPELPNRRFALAPLAELVPDYCHPVLQQTISTLLQICTDPLPVEIVEINAG